MEHRQATKVRRAAAAPSAAAFVWLASSMAAPALADSIPGVCVESVAGNCDTYAPIPVPTGPTPRELKLQREAKDLADAALDANDKGVDAYERGNYDAAVGYFAEAHDYAPDNPDFARNLERARQALRQSVAARELKSADFHGGDARRLQDEASSAEARRVFDTEGRPSGSLDTPPVAAGHRKGGDPVVPDGRRTPQIVAYERERDALRREIAAFDTQLKTLDPKKDAVAISKIKQQKSTGQDKINYLNFSIDAELKKPSPGPQRQGAQ